jgi:integrase
MPKVPPKAVLQTYDIREAMRVAKRRGPMVAALLAWLYEFGSRASEPGLQLLSDVDLRAGRARPRHLKDGAAADWQVFLPFCREVFPAWLQAHAGFVLQPQQATLLFPSQGAGKCYACHGTGKRLRLMREKKTGRRFDGEGVACHHCNATGERWGISRAEVHRIVRSVLLEAKVPEPLCYPHVLRHSIITHLLEGGMPATAVQERVGHRSLTSTLGYAKATRFVGEQMEKALSGIYVDGKIL